MPHSAHVLVAAADDADRGRIAVTLADNGYRVSAACTAKKALAMVRELRPDLVVLGPSLPDSDLNTMTEEVKSLDDAATAVRVVIVAPNLSDTMRGRCIVAGADDVVDGPIHPSVMLARMKPLCRLVTMQAELHRRIATAKALGIDVAAEPVGDDGAEACRVMVVAKPGGMTERAVRSALNGGFALTTEGDPYRAGAAVENERFDAMVLAADGRRETVEPLLYLASHLRGNPSLFNLPVMMLHAEGVFSDQGAPYRYGASMAMGLPLEKAALASNIKVLVRRQRTRWATSSAFRTILRAVSPGQTLDIYPERFFNPHLQLLVDEAHRDGRYLSVALFSLRNLDDIKRQHFNEAAEMLTAQVAAWVTGLVRIEDIVARIGPDTVCVALPDTAPEEAAAVVHRINGILSASDFHLTEEVMQAVRVWIDGGSATLAPGDTPETLLQRAQTTLF